MMGHEDNQWTEVPCALCSQQMEWPKGERTPDQADWCSDCLERLEWLADSDNRTINGISFRAWLVFNLKNSEFFPLFMDPENQ